MDGKVEVSILQWETMRKEAEEMLKTIKELKNKEKTVKIVVEEKNNYGHYKFSPWSNQNSWVPETHVVEKVYYTNLGDVERILFEEAKSKVSDSISTLEGKIVDLESKNRTSIKNNSELEKTLKEIHADELNKKQEEFKFEKNKMDSELSNIKEKHANEITDLKEQLGEKKTLSEIEFLTESLKGANEKIEQLTKDLTHSKLPWWKK